MKKRVIVGSLVALLSIVLSVICFLILPDRVTVNISFKGESSYMSKYIAIAFPLVLSLSCSGLYSFYHKIFGETSEGNTDSNEAENDEGEKTNDGMKYLVFSIVGILLAIWILFKNL